MGKEDKSLKLGALDRFIRTIILPLWRDVSDLKKQSGTSIVEEEGKVYLEISE